MNEYGVPVIRQCEVVQVIKTIHARGKGVEDDPVREVTTFWTLEGERLALRDEWAEEQGIATPVVNHRRLP